MFGRTGLLDQANQFVALVLDEDSDIQAAENAAKKLLSAARKASVEQRDEAIARLAAAVSDIRITRAGLLALICGAIVEEGASIEPIAEPAIARFSEAVQRAVPFVEACVAEANANPMIHANAEQGEAGSDAEEAIQHYGERVSERMPDATDAFAALEWLSAATLAMLMRSKALRAQFQSNTPARQAVARLDELGIELPCFHEMVSLLDDERLIILHPETARGYEVRISGIGNNFQLHTLLAGALIGDVEQGWLPGECPAAAVVALSKDAPITNPGKLPTAFGSFNLWNWTGLRPDGTLPEDQFDGSAHWIWNEGIPADIVPFHDTRIILLGPSPYPRSWGSGRLFPAMVGELEVLRRLPADEARDWLDRIATAPKPAKANNRGPSAGGEDAER